MSNLSLTTDRQFTAHWSLFGEPDIENYIKTSLEASKDIRDLEIVLTGTGTLFGLQHAIFQLTAEVPRDARAGENSEAMRNLLNGLLGDSDVQILWSSYVD